MADKLTRLSDAIRLGATFRPQCQGRFYRAGSSCALGAAAEAITGISEMNELIAWIPKEFDLPSTYLSVRFGVPEDIMQEVVRKNDAHLWSRERIASWLESKGY